MFIGNKKKHERASYTEQQRIKIICLTCGNGRDLHKFKAVLLVEFFIPPPSLSIKTSPPWLLRWQPLSRLIENYHITNEPKRKHVGYFLTAKQQRCAKWMEMTSMEVNRESGM